MERLVWEVEVWVSAGRLDQSQDWEETPAVIESDVVESMSGLVSESNVTSTADRALWKSWAMLKYCFAS